MATVQEELTRDLCANLVDQYYDVPAGRRRQHHWVMNLKWLNECRKIGPPPPPFVDESFTELLLGLPIRVTEHGGFPHLEAD
jgi:hypothetical protein